MKNWTYIEHLAFVICADAVASELDASWEEVKDFYGDVPDAKAKIAKLRSMAIRSQEDIIETTRETCENLGVDPTDYLEKDVIADFVTKVDSAWGGKATVKELYDDLPGAAIRLILGGVGHGVDLGDDGEEIDWLEERGIPLDAHKRLGTISDIYHSGATDLVDVLVKKVVI